MINPTINRANEVIERLFALDEEIANACALRALLEDLNGRDFSVVVSPHVDTITIVRAGILRAFIGSVMACLDRSASDRLSVGQIIYMLWKDPEVIALFKTESKLSDVQRGYEALLKSQLFSDGRRWRNEAIAHLLVRTYPTTVQYETFYRLHDEAEQLVIALYEICDRGQPQFLNHQERLKELARVFWDTYFKGMRSE
jgi:hypothetical protein